ncbi:MAG: hypothetical protein LBP67_04965 [Bacteroidales bacterium]|jgi:hypothetical protein|nr:hypothetical protein [Bacteroidales bacterium]
MKFIIVTIQWLESKGIAEPQNARKSLDGEKMLLHKEFVEPVLTDEDKLEEYNYDNPELRQILNSDEWKINTNTNE